MHPPVIRGVGIGSYPNIVFTVEVKDSRAAKRFIDVDFVLKV
jgi:hypothetical protein